MSEAVERVSVENSPRIFFHKMARNLRAGKSNVKQPEPERAI